MRRNYITPEFFNNHTNGTYNMNESSTFFGSKMLEIEDYIKIGNEDIIWYENNNNEQIDLSIESSTRPLFYSPSDNMLNNHSLTLDKSQPSLINEKKWVINIKLKKIFIMFLFSNLKKYRTFEGVTNNRTRFNSVDEAIVEYIKNNILDRYKFDKIDLFIKHKRIDNNQNLKLNNTWNSNIKDVYDKYESNLSDLGDELKVSFKQLNSSKYNFEYYFNLNFEKI